MPQPQVLFGSYTSTGAARLIEIPSGITKFELFNYTNVASTANPGVIKRAQWQEGMPPGSYNGVQNTNGAATDQSVGGTSGGFTLFDTQQPQLEAPKAGTAVTAATPAVATINGHGYAIGDIVRVTNTTGMMQIAGMDIQITASGGVNSITFGWLPAAGFAAPATAITTRRLRYQDIYKPRARFITSITQAAQAVVQFSVAHGYQVGDFIRLRVPAQFGMTQISGLQAKVMAVDLVNNTVTLDIDSSGFTAFAFPTSALSEGFAVANFIGEDSLLSSNPYENTGARGMHLGTSVVGANNDVVYWEATFGY